MRLTDEEWFRRTGMSQCPSVATFHRELIDLFGSTIKHNSSWIMRYSRFAPPDVLYTHNVSDEIVQLYTRECFSIDPFSNHWKTRGTPGVLTLSSLKAENVEFIIYSKSSAGPPIFPTRWPCSSPRWAHCCLALFLVRENGTFSPADVKRAELIFPALDGYHHAHLSSLFNGLRYTNRAEMEGFIKRPTLIQDRFQERVYSNEFWNEAVATDPTIDEIVHAASTDNATQRYDLDDFILRSEALDRYFPLAPGGRIFVLESRFFARDRNEHVDQVATTLDNFTRREREVLALIMTGQSTDKLPKSFRSVRAR